MNPYETDQILRAQLEALSADEPDYWAYHGKADRDHSHSYFQYPAMMVPRLQATLLEQIRRVDPAVKTVYDPFVGSGTTLVECMMRGLDFEGGDINPLSVLICLVKTGPFLDRELALALDRVSHAIGRDDSHLIDVDFPGLIKWFSGEVAVGLSRIRRAIQAEKSLWQRRFLWVALAECIRLVSNSRTSTFKLHLRTQADLQRRRPDPVQVFTQIASRNIASAARQRDALETKGLLTDDRYTGLTRIRHIDARCMQVPPTPLHDLLLTSPPYGDNASTVPYGQHSFLPLQWVDLADICADVEPDWLSTTHTIDSRSLGGSLNGALGHADRLSAASPSFQRVMERLEQDKRDRRVRVAAFCRDIEACIGPVLSRVRPNAYMVWTVGNRSVGGHPVPIDQILSELLCEAGAIPVARIDRSIPVKRMALKNDRTRTMSSEVILVFRKGRAPCK